MALFGGVPGKQSGSVPERTVPGALPLSAALAGCLARGGLVLTGNARAARALRLAHSAAQRANGLDAWPSPHIYDWGGWTAALWQQMLRLDGARPLLLTPLQEHAVWKRMTEQHGDASLVVSPDSMAKLAHSGYALLGSYEGHSARRRSWDGADAEAFRRWADSFDRACARHQWISRAGLEDRVSDAFRALTLDAPPEVHLVGFDRTTPAQQRVLATLQDRGASLAFSSPASTSPASSLAEEKLAAANSPRSVTVVVARDPNAEIATCAAWARKRLLDRPGCRLAVIVQNVPSLRGEIERTFRGILTPQAHGTSIDAEPFEFSLGKPIAQLPIVKSALLLLDWLTRPLPEAQVSWLLLSGFYDGREGDPLDFARLDAEARKDKIRQAEVEFDWWLRHTFNGVGAAALVRNSEAVTQLRRRFTEVLKFASAQGIRSASRRARPFRDGSRPHSEWVDIALRTLAIAGWPGPRRESSAQFQARQKWEELLESIGDLDFDGSRVDYPTFLTALLHAASETIFAPQSHNAPIQIMGPMESAGQSFDGIWFLGAEDSQWPAESAAHPLLPLILQRELGMPHASTASDWELARKVTERIAASAPECFFSYAAQNDDGLTRPSPLLAAVFGAELTTTTAEAFALSLGVRQAPRLEPQTATVADSGPPSWPVEITAGGADILKKQAACPFQAFAARRLGAEDLHSAARGLSDADRGSIVHRVLEGLWSPDYKDEWHLHTRDDLRTAQAAGRLPSIIEHHVAAALRSWHAESDPWTSAYLASERQRLCRLLTTWLNQEAERESFAVEYVEKRLDDVRVGELKLKLRADRVDLLPSGGRLVLDYKSRKISAKAWEGDRPDEPQLPLYAAYGDLENLQGVLFVQVGGGAASVTGHIVDAETQFNASLRPLNGLVKEPYSEAMRDEWRQTLGALADEFVRGVATVTPKNYPQTCEYCALPSLCRIAELQPFADSDDDPSDYYSIEDDPRDGAE